jgi:hypothetical protein
VTVSLSPSASPFALSAPSGSRTRFEYSYNGHPSSLTGPLDLQSVTEEKQVVHLFLAVTVSVFGAANTALGNRQDLTSLGIRQTFLISPSCKKN